MSDIGRKRLREASAPDTKTHAAFFPEKARNPLEGGLSSSIRQRVRGAPVSPSHSGSANDSIIDISNDKRPPASSLPSSENGAAGSPRKNFSATASTPVSKISSATGRTPLNTLQSRLPFGRMPSAPPGSRHPPSSLSSSSRRIGRSGGGTTPSVRSSTSSRHSGQRNSSLSSKGEEPVYIISPEKQARIFILEYEIAQETEVLDALEMRREKTLDGLESMINTFDERKNEWKERIRLQEQEHLSAMKALVIRRHRCHTRRKGLQQEEADMEERIRNISGEKEIISELILMEERKIQLKEQELAQAKEKTEAEREVTRRLEAEARLLEGDGYGLSGEVKEIVLRTKAVEKKIASILEESMKLEVIRRELFSEAEALKGSIRVFSRVRGNLTCSFSSRVPLKDPQLAKITSSSKKLSSPSGGGDTSTSMPSTPVTSTRSSASQIEGLVGMEQKEKNDEENDGSTEDKDADFFSADAALQRLREDKVGKGDRVSSKIKGVRSAAFPLFFSSSSTSSSSYLGSRKIGDAKKKVTNSEKLSQARRRVPFSAQNKVIGEVKGVSHSRQKEEKEGGEEQEREEGKRKQGGKAQEVEEEEEDGESEPLLFTFGLSPEDPLMTEVEENHKDELQNAIPEEAEKGNPTETPVSALLSRGEGKYSSEELSSCVVVPPAPFPTSSTSTSSAPSRPPFRTITIHQTRRNATSTGENATTETFTFDRVFDGKATQQEVYAPVEPLILTAIDGYAICIFAYGQTGSGKTFSMEGATSSPELFGIIPRAMQTILSRLESLKDEGWEYTIRCSLIEIYNESIRDLLQPAALYDKGGAAFQQPQYHTIQHNAEDCTTTVTRVKEKKITNLNDFWTIYKEAVRHRRTAATILNAHSSRSHCIFLLHLDGVNHTIRERSAGKLCLVDLAGSERVLESGVKGDQLKEAININKSLMNLGKCISAMRTSEVVPWRNSKLTYFLQNYLGAKGGKMLMLVTVSEKREHASESVNALRFASRVSETIVGPSIKRVVKF